MNIAKNLKELPLTLNVSETAKLLGVSENVVYRLTRQKDFPAVRVGEKRLIVVRDRLVDWLNHNATRPI